MTFPDDAQRSLVLGLLADHIVYLSAREKSPEFAGPTWALDRGEIKADITTHKIIEGKLSRGEYLNEPDWNAIRHLVANKAVGLMIQRSSAKWLGRIDEAETLRVEGQVYYTLERAIEAAVPGICRESCLLCGHKFIIPDRYLCDNCEAAELTKAAKAWGFVKARR